MPAILPGRPGVQWEWGPAFSSRYHLQVLGAFIHWSTFVFSVSTLTCHFPPPLPLLGDGPTTVGSAIGAC